MTHFLFIDESGQDHRASPYEVLAGVSIEDRNLWNFIQALQYAEIQHFGRRMSPGKLELKGMKLLKRKTFRLAEQEPAMDPDERTALAHQCLEKGDALRLGPGAAVVTRRELTALGQAKIAFVERLLELCIQFRMRAFASVVDPSASRPDRNFLRKDYAYLFERFFYYLEDLGENTTGVVVFDELERSQAHILVDQMTRYFRDTRRGRTRASRVVPEPFFVHSDLTTLIQVADIVAYLISWNTRFIPAMSKPARGELDELGQLVMALRHRAIRDNYELRGGVTRDDFVIWSFAFIDDLRPAFDRD